VSDAVVEEKDKPAIAKQGLTEWLFADENGRIVEDVNLHEIETIYNGYIQQLIGAYD